MSFLRVKLRRCKGLVVPERDLQNMDGEKLDWRPFFLNHDDARDQLFRIFPGGKTGARRREHRVNGFHHLFIGFPSVMIVIANL